MSAQLLGVCRGGNCVSSTSRIAEGDRERAPSLKFREMVAPLRLQIRRHIVSRNYGLFASIHHSRSGGTTDVQIQGHIVKAGSAMEICLNLPEIWGHVLSAHWQPFWWKSGLVGTPVSSCKRELPFPTSGVYSMYTGFDPD